MFTSESTRVLNRTHMLHASPASSQSGDDMDYMETTFDGSIDEDDSATLDTVDKSFSKAMSVVDNSPSSPLHPQKPTSLANKRHGMSIKDNPSLQMFMLTGQDDEEEDDNDGYAYARMDLSPTAARKSKRPVFGSSSSTNANLQKVRQLSTRLGQLQDRPNMVSVMAQKRAGPEARNRAFGLENGRDNLAMAPKSGLNVKKLDKYAQTHYSAMDSRSNSGENTLACPNVPKDIENDSSRQLSMKQNSFPASRRSSPQMKKDQNQPDGMSAVSVAAGMDVDSPFRRPHSAAPSVTFLSNSPGLGDFFGADLSPPSASAFQRMAQTFKKTAFEDNSFSSPESTIDSPSVPQGMMIQSLGSKAHSGRPLLPPPTFNVRGPTGLANRRQDPMTKKSLAVATQLPVSRGLLAGSVATALPILESVTGKPSAACNFAKPARIAAHPPMRRAFSVCDQGSPSVPSTARDRTGVVGGASGASRVVSQIEIGLTKMPEYQATGMQIGQLGNASAVGRGTGDSSFTQAGLLGFGANEIDGKILPCHSVKEDGLVRITQSTLREVLEGRFSESMSRFHIVDCRFQYEYEGGHIKGAVNINSNSALEELLLCAGKGIHSEGKNLPLPCRSGETQDSLPAVIIFHCEFSNKRAPAFAKHFRSKDRAMNQQAYPKVHFPELYILEGGYCDFYQGNPDKCQPEAYVPMDDPQHHDRRDNNLHDFRKFTRTRSFTYGEHQPQARSAQPCQPINFAGGAGALNRRVTSVKEEDDVNMMSPSEQKGKQLVHDWDSPGDSVDGSPCARYLTADMPMRDSAQPIFGSTKSRAIGNRALGSTQGKRTFLRTASYAGPLSRYQHYGLNTTVSLTIEI